MKSSTSPMRPFRFFNFLKFASLLLTLLLASCASVETRGAQEKAATLRPSISYPPYTGERQKVQVLRYGVPAEIATKYPELADKKIGWGLYNRLLDELYETGRFEFVEEKSEIQQRIMSNWALSESGAGAEDSKAEERGLSTPDYLIYAEVFEFNVSGSESVKGISSETTNTTWIGVQLRLVKTTDGSFVPASGHGKSETTGQGVWIAPNMTFDQSTVGFASEQATQEAVYQLLKRLN